MMVCELEIELEEEGFEPSSPLLVNLFSRQTHSATLPLFRHKMKQPFIEILTIHEWMIKV